MSREAVLSLIQSGVLLVVIIIFNARIGQLTRRVRHLEGDDA